jgi:ubiquinone biosynthesis protein Coq4
MLKLFNKIKTTKNQLGFLKAFFHLVANPNDTIRVYKLQDQLDKNVDPKEVEKVFLEVEIYRQMVEDHYLAPDYKIDDLAKCAPGTLGYAYYRHMKDNGFDKDFYPAKKVVDVYTYVGQRLNETHDLWHVLTGYSPSLEDEIGLQGFYAAQLESPFQMMIIGAGLLHAALINRNMIRPMMEAIEAGWKNGKVAKYLAVPHWEEMWDRSLEDIRREFNIKPYKTLYDFAPQANAERELAHV